MKQGMRFLVRPKTFFNQLQWSTHHRVILISFLVLAAIESQVGRQHQLYQSLAQFLQLRMGIGLNISLWMIMAGRLLAMVTGAFLVTTIIHLIGSLVGQSTSRRVLSRRLTVVFTVFLAGYTVQHLTDRSGNLFLLSLAFYLWGAVLGYLALREQFSMSRLETTIVGLFAVLLVAVTWQFTNRVVEVAVHQQLQTLAKRPNEKPAIADQFKFGTF